MCEIVQQQQQQQYVNTMTSKLVTQPRFIAVGKRTKLTGSS